MYSYDQPRILLSQPRILGDRLICLVFGTNGFRLVLRLILQKGGEGEGGDR